MAFHSQYAPLIISQQQSPIAWFLQQCLNLIVLELDNLLLALVDPANEDGRRMWQGSSINCMKTRLWAGKPTRFRGALCEVNQLKYRNSCVRNCSAEYNFEFG